jgi:hypothetical protein
VTNRLMWSTLVAFASCAGLGQSSSRVVESLALQCDEKEFIRVSARAREPNVIPAVDLTLSDPSRRMQGKDVHGTLVPESQYGPVVEIPGMPDRSTVLAIEICNAEQGVYDIGVKEHGSEAYVLAVTAIDPETHDTLLLLHIAEAGRIRHYRFRFKLEKKQDDARESTQRRQKACGDFPCPPKGSLRWLDSSGQPKLIIEDNDW